MNKYRMNVIQIIRYYPYLPMYYKGKFTKTQHNIIKYQSHVILWLLIE